jgi:hypothetical protein
LGVVKVSREQMPGRTETAQTTRGREAGLGIRSGKGPACQKAVPRVHPKVHLSESCFQDPPKIHLPQSYFWDPPKSPPIRKLFPGACKVCPQSKDKNS